MRLLYTMRRREQCQLVDKCSYHLLDRQGQEDKGRVMRRNQCN